jgi:hypothetical protein
MDEPPEKTDEPKSKRQRRKKPLEFRTLEGNVAPKFSKAVAAAIRARDVEKLR